MANNDVEVTSNPPRAAPPYVGLSFDTWDEAKKYLDRYAEENLFVWSVDSSNSIENENKKLAGRGISQEDWYDPKLKHKNVKLVCVFGGKKRIGSGSGARPMQSTIKADCPVFVHLIASKKSLKVVKAPLKSESQSS
ncbi:uncharacterized protein LOC117652698 [Thrips palmi]|uniref:Uncharacterized protein LOC117652698 n=1 Tax=Thrips palmi TaxID=161013 RepID=A0A6P9A6Y5_THRPL|nr:uncharacterized protein LOC117652698 [Thrips palmi]